MTCHFRSERKIKHMKILLNLVFLLLMSTWSFAQDPFFKLENEQLANDHKHLSYSVLTGYREGLTSVKGPFNTNFKGFSDQKAGTRRIYMVNLSIQDLLTHGMINSDRVILEVKDPSKYRYDPGYGSETEWLRKYGYCYELLLPLGQLKGVQFINDELSRLFKLKCSFQKRLVDNKEVEVFIIKEI